jgi:hypothetical protein
LAADLSGQLLCGRAQHRPRNRVRGYAGDDRQCLVHLVIVEVRFGKTVGEILQRFELVKALVLILCELPHHGCVGLRQLRCLLIGAVVLALPIVR